MANETDSESPVLFIVCCFFLPQTSAVNPLIDLETSRTLKARRGRCCDRNTDHRRLYVPMIRRRTIFSFVVCCSQHSLPIKSHRLLSMTSTRSPGRRIQERCLSMDLMSNCCFFWRRLAMYISQMRTCLRLAAEK
ncbi:hypothetical protein EDB86DRAFT_2945964 [Lactarius hatsudake]|nr:hypothetical protein EDB86DRAFT_2945964 [Lactarius hatsudake]